MNVNENGNINIITSNIRIDKTFMPFYMHVIYKGILVSSYAYMYKYIASSSFSMTYVVRTCHMIFTYITLHASKSEK